MNSPVKSCPGEIYNLLKLVPFGLTGLLGISLREQSPCFLDIRKLKKFSYSTALLYPEAQPPVAKSCTAHIQHKQCHDDEECKGASSCLDVNTIHRPGDRAFAFLFQLDQLACERKEEGVRIKIYIYINLFQEA